MQNVTGEVAFITGGANGIGLGIAQAFVNAGMKVVIADESKAGVESPARQQSRESEQRQQRAVQSIEDDENIKAIQDAFGGTVFEESIRPND